MMTMNLMRTSYKKGLAVLLALAMLLSVLAISPQTAKADTASGTIPAGNLPIAAAVNPVTNKIYVANYSSSNVTVIDGNDNSAATVRVGYNPIAIAVNTVTNKIYVANYGDRSVTVIDGNDNSAATVTVTVGFSPCAVAVNPATNRIYVANYSSGNVTVIDGATEAVTATVATGINPCAVAVNPVTNKIYVANAGSDNVTVIDGATDTVAATVTVGRLPCAVAVNPATNRIYVVNWGGNNSSVTVIDGATEAVTATVTVGNGPAAIAVNPVTNKIYVANSLNSNVTVIDGDDNSAATVAAGTTPSAIAVNPVTNKIYVANSGSDDVTVIDGATDAVTATVMVGNGPAAIAMNPVTNKIYVANYDGDNVTVIDGDDNSTETVAAGDNPYDIALNPVTNKTYVVNKNSDTVTVIDGADNSTTTIGAGNDPRAVAVNPVTNKIYVANFGSDNVTVIDGTTDDVTDTVAAGSAPIFIAVNPATNKVYAANYWSNDVTVIDGADNSTQTVAAGNAPDPIAVNPVTNKIYVVNYRSGNVTVIDGDNSTQTVAAGQYPEGIAVNPETNKIYVANYNDNTVTVIDGADNSTQTVAVGNSPCAVAADPVTNKIYVTNYDSSNVTVIDGATDAVTATVAVGSNPYAIEVNPATNRVYVANYNSDNVTVIDGAGNSTVTIAAGSAPYAITVNPATNKAYAANRNSDNVTVIDAQNEQDGCLTVDIGPLPCDVTGDTTPAFDFTAHSAYTPTAPGIQQIWYQADTMTGEWRKAAPAGDSAHAELAELTKGTHILYAFATDGMEATSVNTGSSIIGEVAAYEFTVVDTPIITTTGLAGAVLQDDYSATVNAEWGVAPYAWGAAGLPAGLSINASTGEISGLPEEAGTFHPQIAVTDSIGLGSSKTFTMQVYAAPDGSGAISAAPAGVDAGSGGNTLTFTYTSGGSGLYNGEITIELPAGWTLPNTASGSDGYVSATAGTVSAAGQTVTVSNIILQLSDTMDITYSGASVPGDAGSDVFLAKQKTTASGTLAPLSPQPKITIDPDNTDPIWPGGAALTVTDRAVNTITFEWPDASDNIGVAEYRIYRNGSLIATMGATANRYTASGLSAGTSYTFMVGAFDNAGNSADGPSAAVDTNTPMTITMGAVPEGSTGVPYSFTLAASDGTAPYTWAASGLPPGLGMDGATGEISGTPAAGTSGVTATLIDSEGQRVTIVFDITIGNSSLEITTFGLPAGTVGAAYSRTLAAGGGDGDYTWLTTGLPDGLKINADTGTISGKVQVSGAYSVKVILLDGSGLKAEKTFALAINEQTAAGKYTVTPDADTAYTTGSSGGIVTVTIKSGVAGYRYIAATVTPVITHEGTEAAVFTLTRGGVQIGLTAVKADFDLDNHPTAGFNVKAGDIIKIYIVDDLSNAAGSNPVLLQ